VKIIRPCYAETVTRSASIPPAVLASLSPGERVIADAALLRQGTFAKRCDVILAGKGVLLSNGGFLYPLGEADVTVPLPSHNGVLGRCITLHALKTGGPMSMKKDFAFQKNATLSRALPSGIDIGPPRTANALEELHVLQHRFLAEESGRPFAVCGKRLEAPPPTKPVLLRLNGSAIGMVQSDFHSPASAMVNMLFVVAEHRGEGYGSLLLEWYVNDLRRESAEICLFYSPENEPARKMYERAGFVVTEEWALIMR
jgi:GNAT superfamily N-acetyltransferase